MGGGEAGFPLATWIPRLVERVRWLVGGYHRAQHHAIALHVGPKHELLRPNIDEARLSVKRDAPRVALPDAEPDRRGADCGGVSIHLCHEGGGDALAVPGLVDVEAPDLHGRIGIESRGRRAEAKLREGNERPVGFRDEGRHAGIAEFLFRLRDAVRLGEIDCHVLRGVRGGEGVAKGANREVAEGGGVSGICEADADGHRGGEWFTWWNMCWRRLAGAPMRVHYSRVPASQEHRKKFLALTRAISPRLAEGELTHLERSPIDIETARAQHAAYARALATLGCEVREVDAAPEYPDSVFIEDIAVVFDEIAVITRPGAESRRGETAAVERALAPLRSVAHITAPGTLDGGDVLVVGKRVFVGRTGRTNDEGIAQLLGVLAPFGYTVEAVEVTGCLHLKTAVTALDDHTVLVNPAWIGVEALAGLARVEVDPAEPMGANVVRVGDALLYGAAYPRTFARLVARGYTPLCVDASEVAKAEGAVTCCSLIILM